MQKERQGQLFLIAVLKHPSLQILQPLLISPLFSQIYQSLMLNWLANHHPPWAAAFWAFMACHLVALDEQPGVQPVGIGEIYCQLITKFIPHVAGAAHAPDRCGNFNLNMGMRTGIEGAAHAIREAQTLAPAWPSPHCYQPDAQPDRLPRRGNSTATQSKFPRNALHPHNPDDQDSTLLVDAHNGFNELS